jgi:hypothetical protein
VLTNETTERPSRSDDTDTAIRVISIIFFMISTRTHGILDYTFGALLLIAPWFTDWDKFSPEAWPLVAAGFAAIVYSVLTAYELGVVPLIPMRVHLALDFTSGLFLASSPWLFGFADRIFLPHLLAGLFEIGAVLMTRKSAVAQPRAIHA